MSIKTTPPEAYADLGDVWLRDQTARLLQKHVQFGRHFRLDVDLLLAGRARAARAARAHANYVSRTRPGMSEGTARSSSPTNRALVNIEEIIPRYGQRATASTTRTARS
jgi:hypothetical protein